MPTTIRKALVLSFGDAEKVNVVTDSIADPTSHQMQVRVLYSGFSGADIQMRMGRYPMQKKAPLTPGYCFVGTVAQLGPQCSGKVKVGDTVSCLSVYDAEAELINVEEKYLIPVPPGIDLQKACALILDWTTAYGMVTRAANVQKAQKVFVHGMSGAVGIALTTLCQQRGATLYGTASQQNHALLKEIGATPYVYTNKDWMKSMLDIGGADVVFDPLGFESWDESYSVLSSSGILVGYGGNQTTLNNQPARSQVPSITKLLARNLSFCGRRTKFFYISRDDKTFVPDLQELFQMLKERQIDVRIKGIFDLERVQDAHRSWGKSGAGVGSMLIRVGGA